MGLIGISVGLLLGILILFVIKLLVKLPFSIVWNGIIGAAILYIVNLIGLMTIKISLIHALIVGIFGIPGLIFLMLYFCFFN